MLTMTRVPRAAQLCYRVLFPKPHTCNYVNVQLCNQFIFHKSSTCYHVNWDAYITIHLAMQQVYVSKRIQLLPCQLLCLYRYQLSVYVSKIELVLPCTVRCIYHYQLSYATGINSKNQASTVTHIIISIGLLFLNPSTCYHVNYDAYTNISLSKQSVMFPHELSLQECLFVSCHNTRGMFRVSGAGGDTASI